MKIRFVRQKLVGNTLYFDIIFIMLKISLISTVMFIVRYIFCESSGEVIPIEKNTL